MYDQYGHDGLSNGAGEDDGGAGAGARFYRRRSDQGCPTDAPSFLTLVPLFLSPPLLSLLVRQHRNPEFDDFGFPHFVFRDPEDVFREFFGGRDPFQDLLDRECMKQYAINDSPPPVLLSPLHSSMSMID